MHEQSLILNLINRIDQLAAEEHRLPVGAVIQIGALAHISAEHFRDHFVRETEGTPLQNLDLKIELLDDIYHPRAQDIVLKSLRFAVSDDT